MIIKIPLLARSKKNSQQILVNKRTGKLFISQSEIYKKDGYTTYLLAKQSGKKFIRAYRGGQQND